MAFEDSWAEMSKNKKQAKFELWGGEAVPHERSVKPARHSWRTSNIVLRELEVMKFSRYALFSKTKVWKVPCQPT